MRRKILVLVQPSGEQYSPYHIGRETTSSIRTSSFSSSSSFSSYSSLSSFFLLFLFPRSVHCVSWRLWRLFTYSLLLIRSASPPPPPLPSVPTPPLFFHLCFHGPHNTIFLFLQAHCVNKIRENTRNSRAFTRGMFT